MISQTLIYALAAGFGLALAAGPLGCVIVWQRMAFFGEMIAHTALLGVGLGLVTGIDPVIGIIASCVVAVLLLMKQTSLPMDTMLGVISHITLALGVLLTAAQTDIHDLHDVLFGDILAVTGADIVWLYAINLAALTGFYFIWRPLLLISINRDMAQAENIAVRKINLAFMLLLVPVIAFGVKIMGTLLVISLLIIPAAAARGFASSPLQMAGGAIVFSVLSVIGGLIASQIFALPSGAMIIAIAAVFFLASFFFHGLISRLMPRKI